MILSYHAMFIDAENGLFGVGSNTYGQLGQDPSYVSFSTKQVKVLDNVISVATGLNHTVVLTSDNKVMTFGSNARGQLGWVNSKSIEYSHSAMYVEFPEDVNIVAIDAGLYHNVALDSKGDCWVWGDNTYGQCGVMNTYRVNKVNDIVWTPRKVKFTATPWDNTMSGVLEYTHLDRADDYTDTLGNVVKGVDVPTKKVAAANTPANRGIFINLGETATDSDGTTVYDAIDVYEVSCGNNFTLLRKNNNVWGVGENLYKQFTDTVSYATSNFVLLNQFLPSSGDKFALDAKVCTAIAGDTYITLLTESKKVFLCGKISIREEGVYKTQQYTKMQRYKTDVNKLHYSPRGILMNRRPTSATFDEVTELELQKSTSLFDKRNTIIVDIDFDIELTIPVNDFSPGIKYDIYVNGWRYLGTEAVTFFSVELPLFSIDGTNFGRPNSVGTLVLNSSTGVLSY